MMYRTIVDKEKEVYSNVTELFNDVAVAYKDFVDAFYAAGGRYLQFDETTLTTFTDPGFSGMMVGTTGLDLPGVLNLIVETTNYALENKPEDLIVSVHMCRGNFRSKHMHADGDYGFVAPIFDKLLYDAFFLEYDDHRSGGLEPLANIKRRDVDVVLGVFTSKHAELEDIELIKSRVNEASQFIPIENIALSPQCGFSSTEEGNNLTEEEQWAKIRHIVSIAEVIL